MTQPDETPPPEPATEEKFTFFYGEPAFSNWGIGSFKVLGKTYQSVEQFMMAEKARLFDDAETEAKIMQTSDPQKAKVLGREVRGFNKDVWEAAARDFVYAGCYAKMQQNPGFLKQLKATAGTTLVEASRTDQIWGIGLASTDPRAQSRRTWLGTNWLGEVLTLVREDLAKGIFRSTNFCWSGEKVVENTVVLKNYTNRSVYIWDHDNMRRAAFDLKHGSPDVLQVGIDVLKNEAPQFCVNLYFKLASKSSQAEGGGFVTQGVSAVSLLEAFGFALGEAVSLIPKEAK
jgi:ribA/ribD-fused uncharacterized protein